MADRLAVTICATASYQYAMRAQARMLHANLHRLKIPIAIILVGDEGLKNVADFYTQLFAGHEPAVEVIRVAGFKEKDGQQNYKNGAQLMIAQMRTAAFDRARRFGAALCWSLDSDVIPKSSACYETLRWLLDIPGGFYQVAIAPYPSQGGGDLLAGRGTPENPIFRDFLHTERKVPAELLKRREENEAAIRALKPGDVPAPAIVTERQAIQEDIDKCEPQGNVFELNGKFGWRRRGWLSNAFPALGRGAFVPSDWCGFGCTLMNARALDECDFTGYEGAGTEDLFVCFNRWHQAGIRIGAALHEPAFHVSRRDDGRHFASFVRFITADDESKGECVGHLRVIHKPFYSHDAGEEFDAEKDGHPLSKAKRAELAKAPIPLADAPSAAPPTP